MADLDWSPVFEDTKKICKEGNKMSYDFHIGDFVKMYGEEVGAISKINFVDDFVTVLCFNGGDVCNYSVGFFNRQCKNGVFKLFKKKSSTKSESKPKIEAIHSIVQKFCGTDVTKYEPKDITNIINKINEIIDRINSQS